MTVDTTTIVDSIMIVGSTMIVDQEVLADRIIEQADIEQGLIHGQGPDPGIDYAIEKGLVLEVNLETLESQDPKVGVILGLDLVLNLDPFLNRSPNLGPHLNQSPNLDLVRNPDHVLNLDLVLGVLLRQMAKENAVDQGLDNCVNWLTFYIFTAK